MALQRVLVERVQALQVEQPTEQELVPEQLMVQERRKRVC
jgi:hypothetical protein